MEKEHELYRRKGKEVHGDSSGSSDPAGLRPASTLSAGETPREGFTYSNRTGTPPRMRNERKIIIGKIIGYRAWYVRYLNMQDPILLSLVMQMAWPYGKNISCKKNDISYGYGIFSFKEKSFCIDQIIPDYESGHYVMAFGEIEMWGDVVEHKYGYRAEHAAVRSIDFVRFRNRTHKFRELQLHAKSLRELYKVGETKC